MHLQCASPGRSTHPLRREIDGNTAILRQLPTDYGSFSPVEDACREVSTLLPSIAFSSGVRSVLERDY